MSFALPKSRFDVKRLSDQTRVDLSQYTNKNGKRYDIEIASNVKTIKHRAINTNGNFQVLKWTIVKSTGENYTAVSDWFIPEEYIKELKDKYPDYVVKENGEEKVKFSLYTSVLANCYKQFCDLGMESESYNKDNSNKELNSILLSEYYDYNYGALIDDLKLFSRSIMSSVGLAPDLSAEEKSKIEDFKSHINDVKTTFNYDKDKCKDEKYIYPSLSNDSANVRKIKYNAKEAYEITVDSNGNGVHFSSNLKGLNDSNNSLANDYDNWLIISPTVDNIKKNVYIRHVDWNTGELLDISNDTEVFNKKDGSRSMQAPNSKNVKLNKYTYQEAFTKLDPEESITSSRSTTLVKNGVQYNYKGCKVGRGHDAITAEWNMDQSSVYNVQEVNDGTSKHEYVVITYYYTTSNRKEPDPQIFVKDNSGTAKDCYTYVVSSGTKISPYIVTPTYTVKELKYKRAFDKNDNYKLKYYITDYVVTRLDSMSIINSDGFTYKKEKVNGKIIGDDRTTLFEGNNSLKLTYDYEDMNNSISNNYKDIKKVEWLYNIDVEKLKGKNTTKDNFKSEYEIPKDRYNGLRYVQGKATYKDYDVLNGGANNPKEVLTQNKQFVNVSNKINVSVKNFKTENTVNHTNLQGSSEIIQKNATFTLTLKSENENHLDKYYLMFDFDVKVENTVYKAYSWIEKSAKKGENTVFTGIPTSGSDEGDIVGQTENHMIVIGMSDNVPSGFKNYVFERIPKNSLVEIRNYLSDSSITTFIGKSTNKIALDNICDNVKTIAVNNNSEYTNNKNLYEDIYYFAWTERTFKTLSRIYDFKVTDCLDVNYKSVFRKSSTGTVNDLTNVQYYSGIKELKIYSQSYNVLQTRKASDKETILPLGPYKNTDKTYIFAPKLGYRISYDLKTSGYFDYTNQKSGNRKVEITPSYYYISKNGNTFNKDIKLYYKNSDGKYVQFTGSNYSIYFTPNDGYRYINNLALTSNISSMSNKLTELKISSTFEITPSMMAASDNNFIQSWYGEFKLPNSTIAVAKNGNINDPLTDGYIGVIFNIKCIDSISETEEIKTSYNQVNKNVNKQNTTQWDYEGYLGFDNPGNPAKGLKLQLEKGTWNIDNDMYQEIKGTVILYDTDARAADDFE